jgi:excisionase family DNA binding protein
VEEIRHVTSARRLQRRFAKWDKLFPVVCKQFRDGIWSNWWPDRGERTTVVGFRVEKHSKFRSKRKFGTRAGIARRRKREMSRPKSEAVSESRQLPGCSPRLFRIEQAAAYCGATRWFIRERIWDGDLPHVRFGKRLLVDKADLDSFIESQKERT